MKMNPFLEHLGKVSHLQYAANGQWEQAIALHVTDEPPSERVIASWLGHRTDFALEVFFANEEGQSQFLGIRWRDLPVPRVAAIVRCSHRVLQSLTGSTDAPAAVAAFEQALGIRLMGTPPDFLEVGVSNLWKSIGSVVIWRQGEAIPTRNQLLDRITERAPQLLLEHPNAVMLEIGYALPQPHWLGLYASRRVGSRYQLEMDALLRFVMPLAEERQS